MANNKINSKKKEVIDNVRNLWQSVIFSGRAKDAMIKEIYESLSAEFEKEAPDLAWEVKQSLTSLKSRGF